jgi:hypothetical protein
VSSGGSLRGLSVAIVVVGLMHTIGASAGPRERGRSAQPSGSSRIEAALRTEVVVGCTLVMLRTGQF